MSRKIIIGSRGSDLALWQANFTRNQLEELGFEIEIQIIKTKGDQIQHLSFDKIEGKGFFTKELEDALLNGDIDLAVHSHKDLPTQSPEGLCIAGVSYREDCSESLLIRSESKDNLQTFQLKHGATVGTSSHRRRSQMLHHRPDLKIVDLRGNVPTRVQKLIDGQYDAILLASAGLNRLNLDLQGLERIILSPNKFIPAPAQGVLAFQTRETDLELRKIVAQIHHSDVQESIGAERFILNQLDGGCLLPLGVYCEKRENDFRLWASLQPIDGSPYRRLFMRGKNPQFLAEKALMNLKSIANQKVYISRNPDEAELFAKMVSAGGFQVEAVNPVRYQTVEIPVIPYADWFFFTSIRTVDHYFDQDLQMPANVRVAAMGSGTAQALKRHGIQPDFTGADGNTRDTAEAFSQLAKGSEVLFPIAAESLRSIQNQISTQATVKEVIVYETQPAEFPLQISADIYVFTSPSCVNAFIQAQGKPTGKIIAIGRTTAEALQNHGIAQVILPPFTTEESLADTVCGL